MRTRLTPIEANDLLESYYPAFNELWRKSFTAARQNMDLDIQNGVTHFTPRHKAGLVWHYAMNHSVQMFQNDPEMVPCVYNKVYGLLFNDALFIRLKKLNKELNAANVATYQAIQLAQQGRIPGFPMKPCILHLGYRVDTQWLGIQDIFLTCPKNMRENIWDIDIMNASSIHKEIPFESFDEKLSPSIEHLLRVKEEKQIKKGGAINE